MRLMMTIKIPVEHGNRAIRDGSMAKAFAGLFEAVKPEATYFSMLDGYRVAFIVYELDEQYKLLDIHEPLFAAMGALIDERPVLNWDDMERAFAELKI